MADGTPGTVVAPPAATPPPAAAPPAAAPPAGDWMSGLDDDSKGYVGNKGFKGPKDVLDSYRNLEKSIGVPPEKLVKLPERFYDDKGVVTPEGRSVFERLGAPKDPKEYGFKAGEGQDQGLVDNFGKWAQDAGLSKQQAEKILNSFNETQKGQVTALKEQIKVKHAAEEMALKTEWGQALEQNTNIAKQAAQKLGMTSEQITALANQLGHAGTMKMFLNFGKSLGEAGFVGGSQQSHVLEPVTAQSKIKELQSDKTFGARLMNGDSDAKAQWQRLHEQAYPGIMNVTG